MAIQSDNSPRSDAQQSSAPAFGPRAQAFTLLTAGAALLAGSIGYCPRTEHSSWSDDLRVPDSRSTSLLTELPQAEAQALLPTPSWQWAMEPQPVGELLSKAVAVRVVLGSEKIGSPTLVTDGEGEDATIELHIPVPVPKTNAIQLVYLDARSERLAPMQRARDSFSVLYLPPRDFQVDRIGVETATPQALSEISQAALTEAKQRGIGILPRLSPGTAVEYELRTIDGQTLTPERFQGQTVVIFEWATWCTWCHVGMKQLFELKALYPDELVLIGVNHDSLSDRGVAAEEMQSFPAGTFNVSIADLAEYYGTDYRTLWHRARVGHENYGLPVNSVIDRAGKAVSEIRRVRDDEISRTLLQILPRRNSTAATNP